ncbi:rod shape-determining protein RodA [Puniceicoccales bacterium CK1056]|uniref:Rod shape-determining protein RodA n=2 Tax=Oceanipulchritudo coccoides TaxID=2706888 RepID=A0A6B2LX99_9BACT|nr:rod shape-determining protein RodA [Oceanipulchritudo coccoides]
MLLLSIIGIFFIYSAQAFVGGGYWIRQMVWIVLGSGVYFVVSRIDYKFYLENAFWFYAAAVLLLLLIYTPLGVEREGARRWLDFKFMAYQPAEAAKVCSAIMMASILARSEVGTIRQSVWTLSKVFLVTAIPMILIFAQPDLGSCLIIPPTMLALLYVSKLSQRFFLAVFGLVLCLGTLISVDLYKYSGFLEENNLTAHEARGAYQKQSWVPLRDYQRERIMTFIAPEVVDPRGTGSAWNSNQAQQAVGTGGLTGKGWQSGLQARLGYLPRSVAHNDFIFAVLAEEKGFIGGLLVIGLFSLLLANGVRIAGMARDRFGMLLSVGVTVIFIIHVFINIGMTIGLTPITGLPLPFLSYGGSFILSCCILQGIVQSVYRYRRAFS